MQDIPDNGIDPPDDFRDRLINSRNIYQVSPKMSEYIDMMETFLLISEKKLIKKISPGTAILDGSDNFHIE